MKQRLTLFVLLVAMAAFSGCASKLMKPVEKGAAAYKPGENEATIIFLRNSFFGAAIQATVCDVTGEETKFIGILSNKFKIAYKTTPGKHMFMVVGENGDFMPGEFEAGKTYFAIVVPRPGFFKARFSLNPVHQDEYHESFASDRRATHFVENTPESRAWFMENAADIRAHLEKDLPRWHKKSARNKIGLLPEDGR